MTLLSVTCKRNFCEEGTKCNNWSAFYSWGSGGAVSPPSGSRERPESSEDPSRVKHLKSLSKSAVKEKFLFQHSLAIFLIES